jgi:4-amino-4-deoxy-L-arabinose transferase-like glycosyltransferase
MNAKERLGVFLKPLLVGAGMIFILAYVLTALARISYPYELEAMEGGMVDHVLQILGGGKLYGPPSIHFVPYAYPPLYYYLAAALSRVLPVGFFPLRLISFSASLGILALIFLFVLRETRDRWWALAAVSLFAATYKLSDAWLDLARIDSLFLLLILLFAYLVRFHPTRMAYAAAALVLLLAMLTKQSALLIAMPILAYAVWFEKPNWPWLLGPATALVGGSLWLLNALHHGWYKYYIFDLTGQRWMEKVIGRRIAGFWTDDMLKPLAVAALLFLAFLFSEAGAEKKKRLFFYLAFAGGMIGTAWFSRLEYGAYGNALLSAHALLAIGFGLALARFWQVPGSTAAAAFPRQNLFLLVVGLVQFTLLAYNPLLFVPNAADRKAGDHLVETLAGIPGDVMVPGHGFLPYLAGKPRYAHEVAVKNLTRIDRGPVREKLEKEFNDAIAARRFSALILDKHDWLKPLLRRNYEFSAVLFPDPLVFWPVTGKKLRPNFIYIPQKVR